MNTNQGLVFRPRRDPATGESVIVHLPVVVYGYFAADGACLYIGQTIGLQNRHHHHRSRSPWIHEAGDPVVLGAYDTKREGLNAEAAAIREHSPAHNVYHNRRSQERAA